MLKKSIIGGLLVALIRVLVAGAINRYGGADTCHRQGHSEHSQADGPHEHPDSSQSVHGRLLFPGVDTSRRSEPVLTIK